jgi:hypothetical protein
MTVTAVHGMVPDVGLRGVIYMLSYPLYSVSALSARINVYHSYYIWPTWLSSFLV